MKILYHHRIVSNDGQWVHVTELIAALRSRGHEVHVVAPRPARGIGESSRAVAWLKRHLPRVFYEVLEFAYSVPAFWRLWRAYRRVRPDILYERYNLFLLAGAWVRRLSDVPFLSEVNAPLRQERRAHGGLALDGLAGFCDRRIWAAADAVLPVSDVLADSIRGAGTAEAKIAVIPNGINRERFPAGAPDDGTRAALGLDDKVVLGFTGFVRPWHGLDRVIPLLAADPDLCFLVIGDGPVRGDIEAAAAAAGVSDRVRFLGFVDRDDIARYTAVFDVALQPAVVAYASPLKIFEYMALGRAIVAPDQTNIREILTHERTAWLFDPEKEGAFAEAVAHLTANPELRRALGRNASAEIDRRGFTWDENARRVSEIAERLLR